MTPHTQGVALSWHVTRRWRCKPAALHTSMISPSAVMALETSWRIAASICSGDLQFAPDFLLSAACRGWSRDDWREARQTAAGCPKGEPAERRRVSQK